jgi:hypothetical protein
MFYSVVTLFYDWFSPARHVFELWRFALWTYTFQFHCVFLTMTANGRHAFILSKPGAPTLGRATSPGERAMGTVSDEEFTKVAEGLRWSERNLAAARAVLVDGLTVGQAAGAHAISQQQASVLKRRFWEKLMAARAMKVSPSDYLKTQIAAGHSLKLLRPALIELRRHGLSDEQLVDYLSKNDVMATVAELRAAIGAAGTPKKRRVRDENHGPRKSKGRSR